MNKDEIVYNNKGEAVTFAGKDAVNCYAAMMLSGHIKLYSQCGMIPTRGYGIKKMLDRATYYTGKKYKIKQAQQASDDLKLWAQTMKLALPERTI